MNSFLTFLRGINVGGNSKVEMARLKKLFESLGYTNVQTYINSGNVIFDTSEVDGTRLVKIIENALEKEFGFTIKCVVRTAKNITKLASEIPPDWQNDTEQKTDVLFLWDAYDSAKSIDLIKHDPKIDTLVYKDGVIIWHLDRKNYNKTGMRKFIGTTVYKNMTARNVNTVRKLAELLAQR